MGFRIRVGVASLGEVRSPREFIYILNAVRHAVGR
jgi:hypothetical protein